MPVDLLEAPELKGTNAATAVLRVIGAPVRTFQGQAHRPRPVVALLTVVLLAVGTALISAPVIRHLLTEAEALGVSSRLASRVVTLQALIFTPLGTVAFLGFVAVFLWGVLVLMGHDVSFKHVAAIGFTAGIAGVMKHAFVAGVLYLRWWLNPAALSADVTTGLDGFFGPEHIGRLPALLLGQFGVFDVWFVVLVTVGLRYGAALSLRSAWIPPSMLLGVTAAVKVLLDLVSRSP